jgi:oligoendopeptidase F
MEAVKVIVEELQKKEVLLYQLEWTQYTTGYDFGVDEAYKSLNAVYENADSFQIIKEALASEKDPLNQRRLALLYKVFEPFHLSEAVNALTEQINEKVNVLSQVLNKHRTIFEGHEISAVDLAQILAKDDNRDRRKAAYFAKNQVNQVLVEAGFIDVLNMRKELAVLRGKESFVALKLEEDELTPVLFDSWRGDMKAALPKMKAIRKKYAERFLDDVVIYPWDEAYIEGKLAPALNEKVDMSGFYQVVKDFFKLFDFDLGTMNITYDVFPRANKSEWGYNFPIEAGKDSRILANVKDLFSEYNVLLHETGHGVHSFLTDPDDYMLGLGISGIISEGIANLFGSLLYEPLFYEKFFNREAVEASFKDIKEWHKVNALRSIHRILFDQSLYQTEIKDQADIEGLYWSLYEELFEDNPFGENPPWAYLIHHTTHPIYLHNYFMGDVTCAMLEKVFNAAQGTTSITNQPSDFGAFLLHKVILESGRLPYPELFKAISGKSFSLDYLL